MTKEELLSNNIFKLTKGPAYHWYELHLTEGLQYYITENTYNNKTHHCNVEKITNTHLHVYSAILGKSKNVCIPLNQIYSI